MKKRFLSLVLAVLLVLGLVPVQAFAVGQPGEFALMAVTAEGFVIEPVSISYNAGATVREALKNSGHTFAGIDSGFISAVDGTVDNFSLYCDGGGFDLDVPAAGVTAVWFTTNSAQPYSDSLRDLVVQMARYNSADNGVQTYPAAKTAYDAAVRDIYQTSNAANLCKALKTAMDAYIAFLEGTPVPVTLQVTQGDGAVTAGKAEFVSEFGTKVTADSLDRVELIPGSYTFDLSDGAYNHVRGTVEVEDAMTLTVRLPQGKWIDSLELSMTSGDSWQALPKTDETDGGATFFVPDHQDYSLYPYMVRNRSNTQSDTSHRVFLGDSTYPRTWASKATALVDVIREKDLEDSTIVLECRQEQADENGCQLYQTYTIRVKRVPTLQQLTVAGDGAGIKLDFDKEILYYAVSTTAETVAVTPTALSAGTALTVAGKPAVSGEAVNVTLADCEQDSTGAYLVPVEITAPNGQSRTYTVAVTKVPAVQLLLTASNADAAVKLENEAGAQIAPTSVQGLEYTFRVVPNQTYTYTVTANGCYHATAEVAVAASDVAVTAPLPKTQDWLGGLGAKAANSKTAPVYTLLPAFDAAEHSYIVNVESNSAGFWLQAYAADTSRYSTSAVYSSHNNSNYSDFNESGRKAYTKTPGATSSKYVNMTNFLANGSWGNEMQILVIQKQKESGVTYYQTYDLTANRELTLYAMSARDQNGTDLPLTQKQKPDAVVYEKLVYDYTAKIGTTARELTLSFALGSSSNAYDYDLYTVTAACGQWSEAVTLETMDGAIQTHTVSVPLSGGENMEVVTLTVESKADGAVSGIYTIELSKLPAVATAITVTPADATVFLADDAIGTRVFPETDGTYILNTDAQYTYVVSKTGYVARTATFIAGQEYKTITVELEEAPESTARDISQPGDWHQFRADENNNGVVEARTPVKAEDAVLEWANQIGEGFDSGATGCPIIVGGYLYTYAGNSIVKVNKETGEVVKSGTMDRSSSFAINSPTYADGMIFVGLSDGGVQAFNAETLESLWLYNDKLGGQPNCPIAYRNGYVYTGFWNSETKQASFVCLSVTDEDTADSKETKLPTWTVAHNGFYWAGAYVCDDFLLIGTDDGADGYTTGYASILSLDPRTGVVLDSQRLPNVGDQRGSICYDEDTDAYYFTTKGGDFYQVRMSAAGTFVKNTLRRLHLDNGSDNAANPPMSTSTPVIHNGRAYIGVSGISQFGAYSGHNMTVIDLETFSIAYSVPTMGYPQTSGLLTTAYESEDGYAYVYFIDNYTPGVVRVLRDKKGMTEVDHTYTTVETYQVNGETRTVEAGYVLFTPYGDEAQYAICSPIADTEGNLYFKNDTARLMRLSSRMTALEITQQPEKLTYRVGETFDGTGMQVTAHYANGVSKDVTNCISFTQEPLTADDTEITVSFAPDKLFEKEETVLGCWQWYQDAQGVPGQSCYLPSATVNIELRDEQALPGDVDGDGSLTTGDAVYLLLHVMFGPQDYPVADGISVDVNSNGSLETDDAVYLLLHVMFGEGDYPLFPRE